MKIALNEPPFCSIQGEGYWTGAPATFIRTQGCNLRCSWCDTPQAQAIRPAEYEVLQLVSDLQLLSGNVFVWTGGEPLLQEKAIFATWIGLAPSKEFGFHLETNGTIPITRPELFHWITVSPKPPDYIIHSSFKCFNGSGEWKYDYINEIKIVIDSPAALRTAHLLSKAYPKAHMSLQPVDNDAAMVNIIINWLGKYQPRELEYSNRWRLSMQLHKVLGIK